MGLSELHSWDRTRPRPTLRSCSWRDRNAVLNFLEKDAPSNLFALSWIETHGIRPSIANNTFEVMAACEGERLLGVCLVLAGRTAMPSTRSELAARTFGVGLAQEGVALEHVVGQDTSVRGFWRGYTQGECARLDRSQTYYTLNVEDLWLGSDRTGVRLAHPDDLDPLVEASAAMYREETLSDPYMEDPDGFRRTHYHRILQNMSYIWRSSEGEVLFKADVSCASRYGAQIAGVYTAPAHRGQGVARRALSRVCQNLLGRYPRVTLYVNADNTPAIRLYHALGFRSHRDYRTIFVT
jgi:predicted GNAT family acetyltransferase